MDDSVTLTEEDRKSLLSCFRGSMPARHARRFRVIHVVLDNAGFHMSKKVRRFLETSRCKIRLHFLPTYAPETNPIERIWWHLHEAVTRNHRRTTVEELVDDVFNWLKTKRQFKIESSLYRAPT